MRRERGAPQARYGDLDEIAWYADNSGSQSLDSAKIGNEDQADYLKRLNENGNDMHDVGLKRANGFGLYDMLGNVWEWVNDWYDQNYYQNSPSQDPHRTGEGAGARYAWRFLERLSLARPRVQPLRCIPSLLEQQPWLSLWRRTVRSLTPYLEVLRDCWISGGFLR